MAYENIIRSWQSRMAASAGIMARSSGGGMWRKK